MRRPLSLIRPLLLGLVVCAAASGAQEANTCLKCHLEQDDETLAKPARLMTEDIHSRQGLSCADCHGGDPTSDDPDVSMGDAAGFAGAPAREAVPDFCGRCHGDAAYIRRYNPALRVDQLALYWTSVHGQQLRGKKDLKVAVCADCHGAHGILPSNDPRSPVYAANVPRTCATCHSDAAHMASYGIPTNQYERYSHSVHGRALLEQGDLGAPACNDCHGTHGATPPGVNSVANVCGQCHPINNELVNQSPHRPAFEKLGIAACETCHGYHEIQKPSDEMVGGAEPAVCARCHSEEKRPRGWAGARAIRASLDTLVAARSEAEAVVRRAERAGMEVGDALYKLNEVDGRLTRARSFLHRFEPDKVREVSQEGLDLAASA
ncbi:MAG: cytochrome c3 family protein, partial [Gemmatimonadota bacterium]